MKKYILLITILITNFSIGQIKNGSVQYGKVTSKNVEGNKEMVDFFSKLLKEADKIEYTLNFNQKEAYFFANSTLLEPAVDFNLAATLGRGILKYYQNDETKEFRNYADNKRTGTVIFNLKQKYDWTMFNESKIIDGYTCYKATTPYYQDGEKKESIIFTAWYTPEIPVSYGPIGFGGLPGLIMELQTDKSVFYVKTINLSTEPSIKIDKLLSPKAVSFEKYNEMLYSSISEERKTEIKTSNSKIK